MFNQIKSEWIKLKSVRSNNVLLIVAVSITLLIAILVASFTGDSADLVSVLSGTALAQLFFVVVGTQIIGQEYRFNTIRPTFSVTPNRLKVVVAKIMVLCFAVGTTTILLLTSSLVFAKIILSFRDIPFEFTDSTSLRIITCMILGYIISALFGFGIGAIVRQPIAGIVIGLVWIIIAENVIQAVYWVITQDEGIGIGKWLPFANVGNAISETPIEGAFNPWISILYFFGIAMILCILGSVIIKKRDA